MPILESIHFKNPTTANIIKGGEKEFKIDWTWPEM
jgi:hypothetical protein